MMIAVSSQESARKDRAARRAAVMSIRKGRLGEPEIDFSPVQGAAAISLATQLTRESFGLAGLMAPACPRASIRVRFVRRGR